MNFANVSPSGCATFELYLVVLHLLNQFSRFTPGVESRRNLELMEATTSFSASSTDHFRFFFSFRITCRRCQGHTTRPCLPLPREPTVGFVHRRRPRHPQLLLYFSCLVSRQLWAAVEVQTNLWSNRNQCGTRQYSNSEIYQHTTKLNPYTQTVK